MILYQQLTSECESTVNIFMNVKNKLKSRAVRFIQRKDDSNDQDEVPVSDEEKTHNLKTELFNIFQIALCFFLLFGGFNTMSQLLVGIWGIFNNINININI